LLGHRQDQLDRLKRKTPLGWFFGFAISFALFQLMLLAITNLVFIGIGIWGVNVPVGWGSTSSTSSGGSASATPAR
jgi:hypothetical protein